MSVHKGRFRCGGEARSELTAEVVEARALPLARLAALPGVSTASGVASAAEHARTTGRVLPVSPAVRSAARCGAPAREHRFGAGVHVTGARPARRRDRRRRVSGRGRPARARGGRRRGTRGRGGQAGTGPSARCRVPGGDRRFARRIRPRGGRPRPRPARRGQKAVRACPEPGFGTAFPGFVARRRGRTELWPRQVVGFRGKRRGLPVRGRSPSGPAPGRRGRGPGSGCRCCWPKGTGAKKRYCSASNSTGIRSGHWKGSTTEDGRGVHAAGAAVAGGTGHPGAARGVGRGLGGVRPA